MPAATSAGAPAKSAAAPSSAMPLTWIIVETAPHLAEDEDTMPHGADILLRLRGDDPPLPATLTLHKRVAHDDTATVYILSADPSGRLLICVGDGDDVDYVLGDVATRLSTRLPSFTGPRAYPPRGTPPAPRLAAGISPGQPRRAAGLIANPRRDGDYFMAELHPRGLDCTHYNALLCYSTEDADWTLKRFASSPHHPPWECNGGVLAHQGKLWWVDKRHGLLTCDVGMDRPDLRYVALPQSEDESSESENYIRHRCIKFSQGQLRCAEIGEDSSGKPRIVLWSLNSDPEGSLWKLELELGFKTLWADASYKAAGLPNKLPSTIALMDPTNFGILYLFYDMRLVSVDMRAAKNRVLGVHSYNTHSVLAWELPPRLLCVQPDTSPLFITERTGCVICDDSRVTGSNASCDACAGRIIELVSRLRDTSRGSQLIDAICLRCGSSVGCKHPQCAGFSLPVSRLGSDWIGWVTGKERFAVLFEGVQVDKVCTVGMPLRLHPPAGTRCTVCKDWLGPNASTLYRSSEFCSLKCWKEGDADSEAWASDLVSTKFSCVPGTNTFCTTCSRKFREVADLSKHEKHVWLKLVEDKEGRACIEISSEHALASSLSKIQPIYEECADPCGSTLLLPLNPRSSQRCIRCSMCLVEGGGTSCCLVCALSLPSFQPRCIRLRNRIVSTMI